MGKEFEDLQNGVVLAELGGYGDGPYCAKYGAGSALVLLGTYVIYASENVPYPDAFVFKPGRSNYDEYLNENIKIARDSGARVGVSAISVELKDTLEFFSAAEEAGADYVSLCAYSVMEMFTSKGLGCKLCYRENWPILKEWVKETLTAATVPFIFKLGALMGPDIFETVELLSEMGVLIVHAAAESTPGSEGLIVLGKLAERCRFLIGGGGVSDVESASRVLSTGAGAVAVASAAMKDPTLLGRLQSQLRE